MRLYAPITKIDVEQRMVWGYASTEARDDQGEIVKQDALAAALPEYMRLGNIREMHQLSAVGKAKEAQVDEKGLYLGARIVDPLAWEKVKERVYNGFSIAGKVTSRDEADHSIINGVVLSEISLVDRPANPEALFDIWKSTEGTHDMPKGLATLGDTAAGQKLAALAPTQLWACGVNEHKHLGKAEAAKCIEGRAAENDAATAAADAVVDPAGDLEKRATEGASEAQAVMDAALAAIEKGEVALSADAETAAATSEQAAKAGDAPGNGDKPYGDVEYADPGYQSDGKKRYPIDTEKHIRAAWNYINKPANAKKYDVKDLKAVKDKIIAAWKAMIDKDGPPSADPGKKVSTASLQKSLLDLGRVVDTIFYLDWLKDDLEWEALMEGDASPQPARLQALIAELCGFLNALVAEETAEILDHGEIETQLTMTPADDIAMASLIDGLRKAAEAGVKVEALVDALEKAAAKNSAHDQALLDMAYGATDKCMKTDGCTPPITEHLGKAMSEMELAGAKPYDDNSADGQKAAISFDLAKKHGGHQALMDAAHDCLGKLSGGVMTGGATCDGAAKAGRRHSAEKMGRLKAAHDHLVAAGASCDGMKKDDTGGDDVAMAAVGTDFGKAVAAAVALTTAAKEADFEKALAAERAEKAGLVKTIGEIVPMLDRLTKRVEDIAGQPQPPRAIAKGTIAVSKEADAGGADVVDAAALESAVEAYAKMSKDEQGLFLIRAAHKRPIPYDPAATVRR